MIQIPRAYWHGSSTRVMRSTRLWPMLVRKRCDFALFWRGSREAKVRGVARTSRLPVKRRSLSAQRSSTSRYVRFVYALSVEVDNICNVGPQARVCDRTHLPRTPGELHLRGMFVCPLPPRSRMLLELKPSSECLSPRYFACAPNHRSWHDEHRRERGM